MTEKRHRVNAYIDDELYTKLTTSGLGITEAITRGLELVLEPIREPEIKPDPNIQDKENLLNPEVVRLYEERISSLEKQLEIKDNQLEKQAIHIQTMLSQKAIEAPGAKKSWWKFW